MIIITKEAQLKKYLNKERNRYEFNESVEFKIAIETNFSIWCNYSIKGSSIKTSGSIRSYSIEVRNSIRGGDIKGSFIKAGHSIWGGDIRGGDIEAGGYIGAVGYIEGDSIEAGYSIKAGGSIGSFSIKAGGDIEAGGSIRGGDIEARNSIRAGGDIGVSSIKAGGYIFSFAFKISCKKITTKLLPFWRDYWAEMPPFKKWKKEILENSNCWDDYKKIITKEEAEKICKWDGWHWILRVQLEMFFGLREEYIIGCGL